MFKKNRGFTEKEKKILWCNASSILGIILFVPYLLFYLLLLVGVFLDLDVIGLIIIIIFLFPLFGFFYLAFGKLLVWDERRQREYIEKRKNRKIFKWNKNITNNSPSTKQIIRNTSVYRSGQQRQIQQQVPPQQQRQLKQPGQPHQQKSQQQLRFPQEPQAQNRVSTDYKGVSLGDTSKQIAKQPQFLQNNAVSENHNNIPELQGNYARTVFLWSFGKPSEIKSKEKYAAYFLYECGIRDCNLYHHQMITDGYLREASPEEKLETLKLPELKEMLAQIGQTVSGKKNELIDRIVGNSDPSLIENRFPEKIYCLSEMGKDFLDKHKSYIEIHRHKGFGISWVEYDSIAKPGEEYLDVMWRYFSEKVKKSDIKEQRNIYYFMYIILDEKGNKSDALEMLLKVIYMDFSGVICLNELETYKRGNSDRDTFRKMVLLLMEIAPGMLSSLKKYKDVYEPDMIDLLYTWKLPIQICDINLFRQIIESAINDNLDIANANRALKLQCNRFIDSL